MNGTWRVSSSIAPVDDEMREAMNRAVMREVFYDGPECEALGEESAQYCGVRYGSVASSGTTAFWSILAAEGIGAGDEIIIPANAYVTVCETVLHVGATPILCDVEEGTANIDVDMVSSLVTPRTRAVVVVHTYGHPVDMGPLLDLAREHGFVVFEDCAHAFGAEYRQRKVGSLGRAGFVSFARKSISVCGQGGVAVTDDHELYHRMMELKRHGWRRDGDGTVDSSECRHVGFNFKGSDILAAIGRVQLTRLDRWTLAREANALMYRHLIAKKRLPITPLELKPEVKHGWLHFVVRCPDRDGLRDYLAREGIRVSIHYPVPVYLHAPYKERLGVCRGEFPITEELSSDILTLPSDPWLGEGDVEIVVGAIEDYYAKNCTSM